jgi:transposase
LIEQAYQKAEAVGIAVWCQDEAGPYQTQPHPGASWAPSGHPVTQPHEYLRNGTAKLLTLFRPATGEARAKGVTSTSNAILHPWLQTELQSLLEQWAREHPVVPMDENRPHLAQWETWLGHPPRAVYPPLRLILIWDNLAGHHSYAITKWLFARGILPLYTPLGGSWLNMAESLQRIIGRRALSGQYPQTPLQIIDWLEQTVTGWNRHPTPFVWNGRRRRRRERARLRRLGGSGAATFFAT